VSGVSIFDHMPTKAKTGIRDRALRPVLGIIDPDHTDHCSPELTAFTGLDVLCHALESYTAVPYFKRSAAPASPMLRPAYQGCNPISDIWSAFALKQCMKYLPRAVEDNDPEAREQMCLASTAAGVGFGK
jgi:hydroxyacid-oxoacid transhydrogenase